MTFDNTEAQRLISALSLHVEAYRDDIKTVKTEAIKNKMQTEIDALEKLIFKLRIR